MALRTCPICRARLERDATHCLRCGIRVAALERRPAGDAAEGAVTASMSPVRRGVVWGTWLVLTAAVAAGVWGLLRGNFLGALDTTAAVTGGAALCVAVAMGGVHIFRWHGEYDDLRDHGRGVTPASARQAVRVSLLVAGALSILLAAVLAIGGH